MKKIAKASQIFYAVQVEEPIVVRAEGVGPACMIANSGDYAIFTEAGEFKSVVSAKDYREKYLAVS